MLHTTTTFSGQAQSRLIKPNQVILSTKMPPNPSLKYYTTPLYIPYYL
jgi:hypothetical protein